MNATSPTRCLLALCSAIALVGCSSSGGLITSLEDLSTESVKEGLIKIPQYRVASIPGWLPFADVGGLYFYKPNRKPASAIGLSPSKESFKLVSEIGGDKCKHECLLALRDQITALGALAQDLVQAQIDLVQARARASPPRAPATALDAARAPDETNRKALESALDAAKSEYNKKKSAFDDAYRIAANAITEEGVLVYRWTSDSSNQAGGGLGSLFGASAQQDAKHNGFALVSGIRTKTLFVGGDLLDHWQVLNKASRFSNRFELTTFVMQGKYIIYGSVADISTLAQAKLKASYQELAALPETLQQAQIDVEVTLSKVSNLSNMGVMGSVRRSMEPVKWDTESLKERFRQDAWLTFYSVESDYTDILDLLRATDKEKGPQRTPEP